MQKNCRVFAYLAGCHIADRPVSLYTLQLVEAPLQLLKGLNGQLLITFIWENKTKKDKNLFLGYILQTWKKKKKKKKKISIVGDSVCV